MQIVALKDFSGTKLDFGKTCKEMCQFSYPLKQMGETCPFSVNVVVIYGLFLGIL